MSREIVNAICRTFPGAEVSDPWGGGHDAWKVGGKMFACIGAVMPGVSVKTDSVETAQMLIDAGVGVKAPYFHRSWVNLPLSTCEDELCHRLAASYRLVRASLTRKAQSQLAPFVEHLLASPKDDGEFERIEARPRDMWRCR
jgi:predicted DNA-binding protein (MmcQ/YjbR family)